jgi:hypothetical protein
VANNDAITIPNDRPAIIMAAKLLANDSDPENDALTLVSVTASTNGAAVTLTNDRITYTPVPGFRGSDRFTYTVDDGFGGGTIAAVDLTVLDANAIPSLNKVAIQSISNGWRLLFAGIPGRTYIIQRATQINGPWSPLQTVVCPEYGIIDYLDTSPPQPSAFYRTVAQ